jgi:thiamine biosynthesis protein ThiS
MRVRKEMGCSQCATIVVSFNGESFALHQGMMLNDFLQARGYDADRRMACAIKGKLIPKDQYALTELQDGDRLDVIAPV